jgi:hypothetical protein
MYDEDAQGDKKNAQKDDICPSIVKIITSDNSDEEVSEQGNNQIEPM